MTHEERTPAERLLPDAAVDTFPQLRRPMGILAVKLFDRCMLACLLVGKTAAHKV